MAQDGENSCITPHETRETIYKYNEDKQINGNFINKYVKLDCVTVRPVFCGSALMSHPAAAEAASAKSSSVFWWKLSSRCDRPRPRCLIQTRRRSCPRLPTQWGSPCSRFEPSSPVSARSWNQSPPASLSSPKAQTAVWSSRPRKRGLSATAARRRPRRRRPGWRHSWELPRWRAAEWAELHRALESPQLLRCCHPPLLPPSFWPPVRLLDPVVRRWRGTYAGPGSGADRKWGPGGCEAGRTGSLQVRCRSRWGRQGCRGGRPARRTGPPSSQGTGWGAAVPTWNPEDTTSHNPGGTGRSQGCTLRGEEETKRALTKKSERQNLFIKHTKLPPTKTHLF